MPTRIYCPNCKTNYERIIDTDGQPTLIKKCRCDCPGSVISYPENLVVKVTVKE